MRRIFFRASKKASSGEKILALWRDGKRDDAVKLLVDLLVLEGWTQEQWDRLETASARVLVGLLDADGGEVQEEVEALIALWQKPRCRSEQAQRIRRASADELARRGFT
jgi:hypothetical protein